MNDRDQNGPGLAKILAVVTVVIILVVVFQVCLPRAATESIVSIPLRTENEIEKLAAAGDSPCKLELVTVKEPDSKSSPFAYAEVWVPISTKSSQRIKQLSTGEYILLHTPKENKQIKVSAEDLDVQFLPLRSSSRRWLPDKGPMPKSFIKSAVKPCPSGRGYEARARQRSVRGLLLQNILFDNRDGRTATRGSEIAGGPENATPISIS